MGVGITMKFDAAKANFFDRGAKNILSAVQKTEYKMLGKFGAYVRRVAMNSIKQGPANGAPSNPGDPPVYHNGTIRYKDFIFFSYDGSAHSVVIGGVLLNGIGQVPKLLEYGGGGFVLQGRLGKRVRHWCNWRPRPHMGPAFEIAIERALPDALKDFIHL